MGRIGIITDSAACLPPELVERHHIHVVPLRLTIGQRVYKDGLDMAPGEFYERMQRGDLMASTSQPSIADFLESYRQAGCVAESLTSIHVSKELSGTYNAAVLAASMVPDVPIQVIDSRTATMAQGFIVLGAARAAAAGSNQEEILDLIEDMIPRVHFYAVLDTLEYLRRGGRVGGVEALVGSVLQVKPILYVEDGRINALAKVRTKSKALRKMVEIMAERVKGRPVHAAVFHAAAPGQACALHDELAERFDCLELYVTEFTPAMGAHTGPGVIGLAFYRES